MEGWGTIAQTLDKIMFKKELFIVGTVQKPLTQNIRFFISEVE